MKELHEFECGCNIIKYTEWKYKIITCIGHSKINESEGGYERVIELTKPEREMIHP